MRISNYLLYCCFALTVVSSCHKDEINTEDDFELYLQEEMDDQAIPALSVLIYKEDEILFERCLGKADITQNITLQPDHLFLLASVSKVVTATALLQLYEDGLFELDDPINDYLMFDVSIPGYLEKITFRHLLTHHFHPKVFEKLIISFFISGH